MKYAKGSSRKPSAEKAEPAVSREVTNDGELLIAMNPTRGLDVGAIEFVHKYIVEQRNKNKAVLLQYREGYEWEPEDQKGYQRYRLQWSPLQTAPLPRY